MARCRPQSAGRLHPPFLECTIEALYRELSKIPPVGSLLNAFRFAEKRMHGMHFATCRRAKDEVIDWLQFYHHRRLHSTLGYLSPMAFEKKRLAEKERARHAIELSRVRCGKPYV